MAKHIHADLIKAWADGAEIEYFDQCDQEWTVVHSPSWAEDIKYRIKPPKRKPKTIRYALYIYETPDGQYRVGVWYDAGVDDKANEGNPLSGDANSLVKWIHPDKFQEVLVYE